MQIGNVKLENPFIAAPLAGVTDGPTRLLARRQGASLVYSEMISGKGLMYGSKNTEKLLKIYEDEKPVAYQIFGSEVDVMEFTAKELKKRDNAILDINLGCPVPKIVKNGEGSALLKNPQRIFELIEALVKNAGKPVTAKIRIGWDSNSINAIEVAKAIEAGGAAAVAVHGRTREQYYTGHADWDAISQVKKSVNIPVIGNGDIFEGEDAIRMMDETGCDFVMIARGALGNPWIYRDAVALWEGKEKPLPPTIKEKTDMMIEHLDMLVEEKGEYAGVREMRKHVGWYLKGVKGAAEVRREINQIDTVELLKTSILYINS